MNGVGGEGILVEKVVMIEMNQMDRMVGNSV